MSEFLLEYFLFLAKSLTLVAALVLLVAGIASIGGRRKGGNRDEGEIVVRSLGDQIVEMKEAIEAEILDEDALKALEKEEKKRDKAEKKRRKLGASSEADSRSRIFVLEFDGDVQASEVEPLRREITAVLTMATPSDEVVLKLESPGGMVHEYGLAASQLERIKAAGVPLTICVDRVAASGGYLMACLGNKILAAPFAVIGSVGVVAQLPNVHRLLKKNDIDFDVYTAGEFKRTVTVFGENSEKGRQKFVEELEHTHQLFKRFVKEARPVVEIDQIATGETWFGSEALKMQLVDQLITSDQYLMDACDKADVYQVTFEARKNLQDRIAEMAASLSASGFKRVLTLIQRERLLNK